MDRTLIQMVDSAFPVLTGIDAGLRSASAGLATATLVVVLFGTTPEGHAQTGSSRATVQGVEPAIVPATVIATSGASADSIALPVGRSQRLQELDALLAVRGGAAPISARQADRAIAAAAARGVVRELDRPQPFRKKSNDLFRTQRALQVGNKDMLLRLRLRAKTRNAMSVELRF
jgi:hypothetical protein